MKKKILVILLMATMSLSLMACSGGSSASDDNSSEDMEVSEEVSEKEVSEKEVSEEEVKKEVSHDFDSKTNQQESFYELNYQIPSSWKRKTLDDKRKIYYYPEDGILMLSLNSGSLDYNESGYDEYVNSLKNGCDNFVEIDRYTTTILDDLTTLNLTFSGVISDTPLTAYNVVFSTEHYTYGIIYADYDVSDYDRSKDFEEIVKSITYKQDTFNLEQDDNNSSIPQMTAGQLNALKTARNYLKTMAFSYTGLIEQLEYEGYSAEDATYAADNCNADWNKQAAKKAQEYLDTMSFSRSGLIEQLQYEGFTAEQAEYGVSAVGY